MHINRLTLANCGNGTCYIISFRRIRVWKSVAVITVVVSHDIFAMQSPRLNAQKILKIHQRRLNDFLKQAQRTKEKKTQDTRIHTYTYHIGFSRICNFRNAIAVILKSRSNLNGIIIIMIKNVAKISQSTTRVVRKFASANLLVCTKWHWVSRWPDLEPIWSFWFSDQPTFFIYSTWT